MRRYLSVGSALSAGSGSAPLGIGAFGSGPTAALAATLLWVTARRRSMPPDFGQFDARPLQGHLSFAT